MRVAGATGPMLRVLDGADHFLHLPGVPVNTAALAPSAVAALQAWAQAYALAPGGD